MGQWLTAILVVLAIAWPGAARAGYDLAQNAHVTNADIVASLERNGYSQSFSQAAANLSSNVEDTSGDLGLYNGSCCTGVLQMNQSNLGAVCRCTSAQYAAMTLDQQTKYWGLITTQGLNSSAVRTLDTMTTFDGEPVDDALKTACAQLGPGNCQKMVSSGSCSGFADSNGMTICRMADKIRNGSNNIGNSGATTTPTANTTNDSPQSAGQDTTTRSANGNSIPIGDPIYCWSCDAIIYAMAIAEATISSALPVLVDTTLPLMVLWAVCAILYRIMMALVAGIDPIRYTLPTTLRALFILTILSNGGAAIQGVMLNDVMVPVLNGATGLGQALATTVGSSFGLVLDNITPNQGAPTTPNNDDCSFNQNGVTLTYLQPAEASALSLACTVHRAMTTEIQIGLFLANSNQDTTTTVQKVGAVGIQAAGLLMTSIGMMGLLKFGLLFLDIMVATAVAVAFTPWSVYCWIFDSTRINHGNLWKRFLNIMFASMMAGIAAVVAVVLLLASMQAGIGAGGTVAMGASDVLVKAQQIIQQMDQNVPQTMAAGFQFVLFTVCGAMAASHVLGQSQKLASAITGMPFTDALSRAAFNALSSTVGIGLGFGAGMAGALASPLGRALSKASARMLAE